MVKLSVCCCSLNARFDTKVFIEALQEHNKGFDFEVVCTHDARCDDGSAEEFEKLAKKYDNVKFVTHTKEDTNNYFRAALHRFDKMNLLTSDIRKTMHENFDKYLSGELIDPSKGFLWQSSGVLYNKAVEASTGEVVIVTPGDFVYLFSLADLYRHVTKLARKGLFYASPPAIWARINNHPRDWIVNHANEVHNGTGYNPAFRWDSRNTCRDFLGSKKLEDLNLPNFKRNKIAFFNDPNFLHKSEQFCSEHGRQNLIRYNAKFHGFHVMTRKTFDQIGGFSEEWPHRAFADDKMTTRGVMSFGDIELPPRFSVAWCGQYEMPAGHGPEHKENVKELAMQVDEYYGKHPVIPGTRRLYLYSGKIACSGMAKIVNNSLNRRGKVVRF